jgi:hypothetical protein
VVTTALVIVAFLLYYFLHERTFVFYDAHSLADHLKIKSDLEFSESWLHMTLFAKLQDHLNGWKKEVTLIYRGNISIIINIPFLAAFIVFWIKCFLHETKMPMRLFFILPVLLLFYHIAAFFMFTDFGRWMIMVLNIQFMFLFYLLHTRNETALVVAERIVPRINRNWFICVLVYIITAFLGPVDAIGPSDRVARIVKGIFMILGR